MLKKLQDVFDINESTLSGCVDVIVAEQADLSLKCSSFHVRFGKFKVLKSNEKEVIIKINDIEQSVHMKMDSSGKAYFEELKDENVLDKFINSGISSDDAFSDYDMQHIQSDDEGNIDKIDKEKINEHLAKNIYRFDDLVSPLKDTIKEALVEKQKDQAKDIKAETQKTEKEHKQQPNKEEKKGFPWFSIFGGGKKKQEDQLQLNSRKNSETLSIEELQKIVIDQQGSEFSLNAHLLSSTQQQLPHTAIQGDLISPREETHSEGDKKASIQVVSSQIPPIEEKIIKESEGQQEQQESKQQQQEEKINQELHQNQKEDTEVIYIKLKDETLHLENLQEKDNLTKELPKDKDIQQKEQSKEIINKEIKKEKEPQEGKKEKELLSKEIPKNKEEKKEVLSKDVLKDSLKELSKDKSKEASSKEKDISKDTLKELTKEKSKELSTKEKEVTKDAPKEQTKDKSKELSAKEKESFKVDMKDLIDQKKDLKVLIAQKKKDIDCKTPEKPSEEKEEEEEDDEEEEDNMEIGLSLCNNVQQKKGQEKSLEVLFEEHKVTFEQFSQDPLKILNDKNLLLKIGYHLYPWEIASTILVSKLAFGQDLPDPVMHSLIKQQKKKQSSGFLDFLFRRNKPDDEQKQQIKKEPSKQESSKQDPAVPAKKEIQVNTADIESIFSPLHSPKSEESGQGTTAAGTVVAVTRKNSDEISVQSESSSNACGQKRVKKVFRPKSDILKSFNLKYGANKISFTVKTQLLGEQTLEGYIFFWKQDTQIVISDIDGTITKSDMLGQIMPLLDKDWSHEGVIKLLQDIVKNGYKILYLTARAIGQSSQTRGFIYGVKQEGINLPIGPVIMSSDRLFESFKREVIDKKPEVFKIAVLREIQGLFSGSKSVFFAGFGNRETDCLSYRAVQVSAAKIYIINPAGELHQINTTQKTSYQSLNEQVNQVFPLLKDIESYGRYNAEDQAFKLDDPKVEIPKQTIVKEAEQVILESSQSATSKSIE